MKTIQKTLNGTPVKKEMKSREDKTFIAYTIIFSAEIGDTFRDILRKITEKAPLIRYKNEAGIKSILAKMRRSGTIEMEDTFNGSKVTKISDEALEKAREFHEKFKELRESEIFF